MPQGCTGTLSPQRFMGGEERVTLSNSPQVHLGKGGSGPDAHQPPLLPDLANRGEPWRKRGVILPPGQRGDLVASFVRGGGSAWAPGGEESLEEHQKVESAGDGGSAVEGAGSSPGLILGPSPGSGGQRAPLTTLPTSVQCWLPPHSPPGPGQDPTPALTRGLARPGPAPCRAAVPSDTQGRHAGSHTHRGWGPRAAPPGFFISMSVWVLSPHTVTPCQPRDPALSLAHRLSGPAPRWAP